MTTLIFSKEFLDCSQLLAIFLSIFLSQYSLSALLRDPFDTVREDVKKVLVCNQRMKTRNPQTAGSLMDWGWGGAVGGGLRFPRGQISSVSSRLQSQARSVVIATFLAHQQWLNTNVFNSWTYF